MQNIKIMDYRKFYEDQTGEPIQKGFEIHHLDHDRSNNNFDNLIALPKKLHNQYHSSYDSIKSILNAYPLEDIKPMNDILGGGVWYNYSEIIKGLESHIEICREISGYVTNKYILHNGGFQNAIGQYLHDVIIKNI